MVEKEKYIERVKKLHFLKKGVQLSDSEASDCFEKLVALVSAVYQPIPMSHGTGRTSSILENHILSVTGK